jgi:hypothetical protein
MITEQNTHMIELMKLGDIIETPKGVVFAGANANFENIPYSTIKKILNNISNINYVDRQGIPRSNKVLDVELHPSIGNNFNIFLLIDGYDTKNSPEKSEIIYCPEKKI